MAAPKKEKQTRLPGAKHGTKQSIEELAQKSKISLWIDDYGDIFSDFDPRPYSKRLLSDDFLREAKKAVRETKKGELQLSFLVPKDRRNSGEEGIIKRRLRDYFRKQAMHFEGLAKKDLKKGIMLACAGFVLMVIAAFIYYLEPSSFYLYGLVVLLEPAGWFSVWYGFDMIFYFSREKNPELNFNQKMAKADIIFNSY